MNPYRLVFSACLILCAYSCSNNDSSSTAEIASYKMDSVLTDVFTKRFPNYAANDLVNEKAKAELLKKVDSLAPLGYLSDIPLKALSIRKNPHGTGAIVQLYTDNNKQGAKLQPTDHLGFDIIGVSSEELAASITERKKYFVSGKFLKRLNNAEVSVLTSQTYFSSDPELGRSVIGNLPEYNIGVLLFEIDSFQSAESLNKNR